MSDLYIDHAILLKHFPTHGFDSEVFEFLLMILHFQMFFVGDCFLHILLI